MFRGERVKLAAVRPADASPLPIGEVRVSRREVLVGTATSPVALSEIQAPGRKRMAAVDWARGVRVGPGERLT